MAVWLALILVAGWAEPGVTAPRFICYAVHPGDNAAQIALRLTGDARNWNEPSFQILDPVAARFVAKNEYVHLQSGWQACIAEEILRGRSPDSHWSAWWWVALLCAGSVFTSILAYSYTERTHATFDILQDFGNTFVREFVQPLSQEPLGGPPLRSRLRIIPHRERLEILLAPNQGWRYPNLSDHRKNLEYDVERVVTLLSDERFVCGQFFTRGNWIVIPFRFQNLRKEG
jgi:hypothetical protein